jgi:hypothetical protein
MKRRDFLALAPMVLAPRAANAMLVDQREGDLIVTDFSFGDEASEVPGQWSGFTDRVMGGVSNADFERDVVDGRRCVRLKGRVTRDSGGGFIQLARYFGTSRDSFDASAYKGVELDIYGNNEEYNAHIRTSDVRWYEQSYRATFTARPQWETVRISWDQFVPYGIEAALDTSHIQRFGLLGWMREFEADLALARMAFYS